MLILKRLDYARQLIFYHVIDFIHYQFEIKIISKYVLGYKHKLNEFERKSFPKTSDKHYIL